MDGESVKVQGTERKTNKRERECESKTVREGERAPSNSTDLRARSELVSWFSFLKKKINFKILSLSLFAASGCAPTYISTVAPPTG